MSVGFTVTYGPRAEIACTDCGRRTRMVGDPGEEATAADAEYYRRIHVHGCPDGPWDVEDNQRSADVPVEVVR